MDTSEPPRRKLVSLRHVSRIERLTSSETREVVMVGGWPVVVPKGEFTLNQLVLFFEIDSFLPFDDKRFETYRSSHVSAELHGKKGWIVQTVMIDGHVSQGMVFSMDQFDEVDYVRQSIEEDYNSDDPDRETQVDADLLERDFTDSFDVQRWTAFYRLDGGRDLGRPPHFLPDNTLKRAQNLPDLWKTYGDKEFEITELLDGIPITVYQVKKDGGYMKSLPGILVDDSTGLIRKRSEMGISIGQHDYEETEDSTSWAVLRKQGVIDRLRKYQQAPEVVLVGVLCGVGISGNPHEIRGRRFYGHTISSPSRKPHSIQRSVVWWNRLRCTVELVPTISRRIRLSAFAENIDELMMKAAGDSFVSNHERGPSKRKGLVFRALDRSLDFKAISNAWLLDETEKLRNMDEGARCRPGPNDAT